MQFRTDADLTAALKAPNVTIKPLLEMDWNRDGNYSHAYSNLSSVVDNVSVDFASLHSDLPTDVNTVVGSSSGIMKAVVVGDYRPSGMRVSQLLSRYWTPSPFYGVITVEGTPIRYSRQVLTRAGYKVVRQFTGWITDYDYDEASDETTINCSDVFDMQNIKVTLPVWASGPGPNGLVPLPASGLFSSTHTINNSWPQYETLRQAGRAVVPEPRFDAVAYWSCTGALLPSEGYGSLWDAQVCGHSLAHLGAENGDASIAGQYGIASGYAGWSDYDSQSFCRIRTGPYAVVVVPDRGSADPDRYVSMSGWFNPGFLGPGLTDASNSTVVLDSVYGNDFGYVQLQVFGDGSVWVTLHEAAGTGSSNANTSRTWQYHAALPVGAGVWSYVEFTLHFTNSTVSIVTHLNHVVASPTVIPSNLLAFKYLNQLAYNEPSNWAWIEVHWVPCQTVQICCGLGAGPAYSANQSKPAYEIKGLPNPSYATYSTNNLSWLPNVDGMYAWDVLKDSVSGELGCLFTREDGTVWIMGKNDVNFYGMHPIGGWGGYNIYFPRSDIYSSGSRFAIQYPSTLPGAGDFDDLSRAKLQALNINPSAIAYRNDVSVDVDLVLLSREIVWQSSDAKQFLAPSGSTSLSKNFSLVDIQSIYTSIVATSATASADTPDITKTTMSSVSATTPANPAAAGWLVGSAMTNDQRTLTIFYGAGLLSPGPVYVGAILLANQANLKVGGLKYGNPVTTTVEWQYNSEVVAHGVVQLVVPKSDWMQDITSANAIVGNFLLSDVIKPAPLITNISVPVDPRRQLLDTVKLPPSDVVSGDLYGMVMGKRIYDTASAQSDQIDIRVLVGPSNTLYWDDPAYGWDLGSWG